MNEIAYILNNGLSRINFAHKQNIKVSNNSWTDYEKYIKKDIPDNIKNIIPNGNYKIYGSYGIGGLRYAHIPWIAILNKKITKTAGDGYYIVILFKQNMNGFYLSLNQGVTEYKKQLKNKTIIQERLKSCAKYAQSILGIKSGWSMGPINLGATNDLGKGYEVGSIYSKYYTLPLNNKILTNDMKELIDIYDLLYSRAGSDLNIFTPVEESFFQNTVNNLTNIRANLPLGPVTPPAQVTVGSRSTYKRNPKLSAEALHNSKYQCEIAPQHSTFQHKGKNHQYVEAHHIIPMSEQKNYSVSLDVPENIIALCPNCHKKLHHGNPQSIKQDLGKILKIRNTSLKSRGIIVNLSTVMTYYRNNIEED